MHSPKAALIAQPGIFLSAVFLLVRCCSVDPVYGTVLTAETIVTLQRLTDEGLQYQKTGQFEAAIEKYKAALAIAKNTQDTPIIALLSSLLGSAYVNLRRWQEAAGAYEQAVRIKPDDFTAYAVLGAVYKELGRYQEAEKAYKQAIRIKPVYAEAYHGLGLVYANLRRYQEAVEAFGEAIRIQPDFTLSYLELGWTYNKKGMELYQQGRYAEAARLGEQALAIVEKAPGPDHPDTAVFFDILAGLYEIMGDYVKALPLHQRALTIREKVLGPDHPDTARTLNNLARLHQSIGDYEKALLLYQRALAIREKGLGFDHPDTATSLDSLAGLHTSVGEYAKALPLHQRALAIREKVLGPDHLDTALSLNSLAQLYESMGDYAKALPLHQRALTIREKVLGPDHPGTNLSLIPLARLYESMGEYTKALPLLQQALAIQEKALGPDHPITALCLHNLAELHRNMGEYAKALPLHQRALAVREKVLGPDHPHTGQSLNNLAGLYSSMGDRAKALPLYQRALAITEKVYGPDHPDTAAALNNLADLYESMGDYAKALQFAQRGLAAENHAIANVFPVASEEQKLLFVQKSQGSYLGALSLIHHHFPRDAQVVRFGLELVLRRKGIVLDAQSRAQEALAANLKGETLQSWQRLTQHRSALSRLLLSGPGDRSPTAYRQRIEELQAAIAREEEFLAQHSGLVAQELAQRQVTAQMLSGRLPKDGTLVEFVRIWDWDEEKKKWSDTERYLAFILTPDNQVNLVDLGEARKIDAKITAALAAINHPNFDRDPETYSRKADAELLDLYSLLLQPLEAALGSRRRLILSPDGELNKVPFAALRTPDGHYLVEKITLSYVASGRDLLRGKSEAASTVDLLLVANPTFDDRQVLQTAALSEEARRAADCGRSFPPLSGTAEEARIIPPLVKGTQRVLEGRQATESAVRTTNSPKVLHLATHGFFCKDEELPLPDPVTRSGSRQPASIRVSPMVRSGLALTGANHAQTVTTGDDGLLTALEVSGMNLYGTDLVVLSACETAAGEVKVGEGVYGLRRAFVLAGAKNLVMSLWQVGDETTRRHMEEFYQAYGRGEPPAEALRRAQLQTIASRREWTATLKEPLAPVKLWAPFIVQQTGE